MAPGDVFAVETGGCSDLHYVDTGMYDTAEYGSVYLLDADRPAVVDTGIGTHHERILAAMDRVGIDRADLAWLAVTHVHLDHAGGAGFLAEACPNATVAVHPRGARHLVDPSRLVEGTRQAVGDQWQYYTEPEPVPQARIHEIENGDSLDLGDHTLRVHAAPGHAPHQVVFENPENAAVFTADAAGIYVPSLDNVEPTSPPPQFDLEQALVDVETLQTLDPETLCYAHFGPALADDRLAEYADVLEAWVEDIEHKREQLDDDAAVVEYFATETEMDRVWGADKAASETAMNVRGVLRYLDHRE